MLLPDYITLDFLKTLPDTLEISQEANKRISINRTYLDEKLRTGETFYGINTGFGSLCNVRVKDDELTMLQENLVCSHACGMGDELPEEIVRIMLLLKIHGLSLGYSGVRNEVVQRLADLYNKGLIPVVYELGSLGASGDLAPLAHLSLPILGKGQVYVDGKKINATKVLSEAGLASISLAAKEGLALLNGTQFMSSCLTYALLQVKNLLIWADLIAGLSADAYLVKNEPFLHSIHRVRPHKGQLDTADRMLTILKDSQLQSLPKEQVQDPYSFRCIPQVHGATKDVADTVEKVLTTEINSVTDNPIVFHDEDAIRSGGNFHGQTLALHADFLSIAISELANIAERRIYLLVSGQRGLPPFLAPNAGLNSGFMIAQYTAASIVSQNKQYCTPASVDSIVSSNGQEDHVSMGANAATKLLKVVKNVQRTLGIELLTAAQAIEFRQPVSTSPVLENLKQEFRKVAPFMETDCVMHDHLVNAENFLNRDAVGFVKWLNRY